MCRQNISVVTDYQNSFRLTWAPLLLCPSRKDQRHVERLIDNFGGPGEGERLPACPVSNSQRRTNMLRRMVTRMGLPALAGLSLLLAGGSAKADQQGWPVAGNGGAAG